MNWRRNIYILSVVQLLSTVGFSLVFPFLPLYISQIGIATWGSVEFWVGLAVSLQAVTMTISAPVWGALADRYGRKMMLARATLGGAVLLALMGFAQNAEQFVFLRMIQGAVTGVVAAANAIAAATSPKEHSGASMGLLNMARWTGTAAGPIIGGFIGDALGFRASFWITGGLLGMAGLCVLLWVEEDFKPASSAGHNGFLNSYWELITTPGMPILYSVTFLRSLGRTVIMPFASLFVVDLMGSQEGAASVTGVLIGVGAFTGAISSVWLGRLGDRIGHGRVMSGCALVAVFFYIPQPFVSNPWQLIVLQGLSGFAVGGLIPTVAALMNLWMPPGSQGVTYGLENSINSSGRVFAPMLGATIAFWIGLRWVFGAAAIIHAIIVVFAFVITRSKKE